MPVAALLRDHTAHASVLWLRLSHGILKQSLSLLASLNGCVKLFRIQAPNSSVRLSAVIIPVCQSSPGFCRLLAMWFFGMAKTRSAPC